MIPITDDFVQRFNLEDFVIVAHSGLMNATNISLLESAGYQYIIDARIRNESPRIKEWILSVDKVDGNIREGSRNGSRNGRVEGLWQA